jgi:transcriptional regulator with XRE-family HTH domain
MRAKTLDPDLRRLRLARGLAQKDVADALGVQRATVCGWEKKKRKPSSPHILAYAALLGITPTELVALID